MAKNIIKEIIIILLLTIAIILILGVLLYEYVPTNKVIPEKVAYTTPEEVKEEIEQSTDITETVELPTYTVTATDLNNYKRIQEYVPGRKNPFASLETTNEITGNASETNGSTSSGTTNSGTTSSGSSTNENTGYLPDKGTK